MLTKELIEFGLNEKEAKAYLALLELEIAGVQEIAKAANINRSSAYVTLESLRKRGLVGISDDKRVRQYVATSPEVILRAAEDKAISQENLRRKIEKIIPDMKALYKGTKIKPVVRVFEGKEGLINAFEDTLNSKEKFMRVMSAPADQGKLVYEYIPEYVKKRIRLGIKMNGIHPDDEEHRRLAVLTANKLDKYVLIPRNRNSFPAGLAIYDNRIGYMTNKDGGMGIIIESKEMSEIMKTVFDLAWEEAKRLSISAKKNTKRRASTSS